MELLRTIIVMESIVLGLLLCSAALYFYIQGRRITDPRVFGLLALAFYYCLPGIVSAFSSTLLHMAVPLANVRVESAMAISLPLLTLCTLAGLFIRLGRSRPPAPGDAGRTAHTMGRRYMPGRLFVVSLLFFGLGLIGVYVSLRNSGGWLSVLQGGGSAYMAARVTQSLGLWGILVCFIPVSAVGMIYGMASARALLGWLRWPLVIAILVGVVGLLSLLTVRHQSVMLLLALVAYLEIRSGKYLRILTPILLMVVVIGAVALASIRYGSRTPRIDQISGNVEEIAVSQRIIGTIQDRGYIWGGNIPDLFVFAVPRAFWPQKPMGSSINRAVFWEYSKLSGVKTVGLLAEGYASGGYVVLAIEALLFGVVLRRLHDFWQRCKAIPFEFIAYGAILLGFIYQTVRTGFISPSTYTFLAMLLQLWVTRTLCGLAVRPPPRRVSSVIQQTAAI